MHPPLGVDVQNLQKPLAPRGALGPGRRGPLEHLAGAKVGGEGHGEAGERDVALPVAPQVRKRARRRQRRVVEGRAAAEHRHRAARDEVLPPQDLEERRLPGAVGPEEQAAGARGEGEVHVDDDGGHAGEGAAVWV